MAGILEPLNLTKGAAFRNGDSFTGCIHDRHHGLTSLKRSNHIPSWVEIRLLHELQGPGNHSLSVGRLPVRTVDREECLRIWWNLKGTSDD